MQKEVTTKFGRPFEQVRGSLVERYEWLDSILTGLTPELQAEITTHLTHIDIATETRPNKVSKLPETMQTALPGFIANRLERYFNNNTISLDRRVRRASGFLESVNRLSNSYVRLQELAQEPAHTLDDYARIERASLNVSRALYSLIPEFQDYDNYLVAKHRRTWGREVINSNIQLEIQTAQAQLLNQFTDEAIGVVDLAFSGAEVDQERLRAAGSVLHATMQFNTKLAGNNYITKDQKDAARELAIRQNLALMRNDALGYHSHDPLQVAGDYVWHARYIVQNLLSPSPAANEAQKQRVIHAVSDLADGQVHQVTELQERDAASLRTTELPPLIRLRETDELLLELLSSTQNPAEYTRISQRLIATYETLGQYHLSQVNYQEALPALTNAIQLSLEQEIPTSDSLIQGIAEVMRQRAQSVSSQERAMIWYGHLQKLKPSHAFTDYSGTLEAQEQLMQKKMQVVAEIAQAEKRLTAQEITDPNEKRLVTAIMFALDQADDLSVELLQHITTQIQAKPDSPLARLTLIGRFLTKDWEKRKSLTPQPLLTYQQGMFAESAQLVEGLRQAAEENGKAAQESALRTSHAALRVELTPPFESNDKGTGTNLLADKPNTVAACMLPLAHESGTMTQSNIPIKLDSNLTEQWQLGEEPPTLEALLKLLRNPFPVDDVEVATGLVLIPVVDAPSEWVKQAGYSVNITTGPAVIYVFREGNYEGGYIATGNNDTVPIKKSQGAGMQAFLWEPQPLTQMTPEQLHTQHGGVNNVGEFQIIVVPMQADTPKGGNDDMALVPNPPGGVALEAYKKFFDVYDQTKLTVLQQAFIDAMLQRETQPVTPIELEQEMQDAFIYTPLNPNIGTAPYSGHAAFRGNTITLGGSLLTFESNRSASLPVPTTPTALTAPALLSRERRFQVHAQKAGIGVSTILLGGYHAYTEDRRPDSNRKISVFRLTAVGVSQKRELPNDLVQ